MIFSATKDNKRARFSSKVTFVPSEAGGERVLEGLAVVYGPLSDDRGGYKVRIAPGAAVYTDSVIALINHNLDLLIGNTENQTLSFTDKGDGIYVRIVLPNNVDGEKAWVWVRDKYANGMSFGCIPQEWEDIEEEIDGVTQKIRVYTEMLVDEFTITHSPAFIDTTIEVADDSNSDSEPEIVTPEAPAVETETPAEPIAETDYAGAFSRYRYLRIR